MNKTAILLIPTLITTLANAKTVECSLSIDNKPQPTQILDPDSNSAATPSSATFKIEDDLYVVAIAQSPSKTSKKVIISLSYTNFIDDRGPLISATMAEQTLQHSFNYYPKNSSTEVKVDVTCVSKLTEKK